MLTSCQKCLLSCVALLQTVCAFKICLCVTIDRITLVHVCTQVLLIFFLSNLYTCSGANGVNWWGMFVSKCNKPSFMFHFTINSPVILFSAFYFFPPSLPPSQYCSTCQRPYHWPLQGSVLVVTISLQKAGMPQLTYTLWKDCEWDVTSGSYE